MVVSAVALDATVTVLDPARDARRHGQGTTARTRTVRGAFASGVRRARRMIARGRTGGVPVLDPEPGGRGPGSADGRGGMTYAPRSWDGSRPQERHAVAPCASPEHPHLRAVSDLHVGHPGNAAIVQGLRPRHPGDWLLVAGDVAEFAGTVLDTLESLARRFARVVWVPGNHELWTHPQDPVDLRGEERYRYLVREARDRGVLTPEDPYERWNSPEGPLLVVPVFVLYDYSFRPAGKSVEDALGEAYAAGHVFNDEFLLHPDPYPDRSSWCRHRVDLTERRLAAVPAGLPIILVNHYPLVEAPTRHMFSPHLPLWCGTRLTGTWHADHDVRTVVYGHLHMPHSVTDAGVSFEEVSLGYPREREHSRVPFEPRVIACGVGVP